MASIRAERKDRARAGRLSREEKAVRTEQLLIEAAAEIVGKYGYAEASISRITEAANVAQGTFYNYFETRQDILDLLPPRYAEKMNEYIASRMEPGLSGLDREVRRLEAFFDFFRETKESARLVNEATVMAPAGFARFSEIVRQGYIRALTRSMERGEIKAMGSKELADVADLLIAIRNGLSHMILSADGNRKRVPKRFVASYRTFVGKALFGQS